MSNMRQQASGRPGKADEKQIAYSESAVRNNFAILEYSRTCQAAVAGGCAGILGLTGLWGFVFYVVTALMQSALWFVKANGKNEAYFVNSVSTLVSHGMMGGAFTYILFWTLLYGMVHVY